MTGLEKRILDLARKHPEFNESVAISELETMNGCNSDLIDDLWKLYISTQNDHMVHTENKWNSHLAYCLDITLCKPIQPFNNEKRRTYGRSGFPDIDMDFDYVRRPEIFAYLQKKYGTEYVGNIGTIQTLKVKASVRRAIKVLDPTNSVRFDKDGRKIKIDKEAGEVNANFALENEILSTLPDLMKRGDGSQIGSVEEACEEFTQFNEYMTKYPEVKRIASSIEGTISGYGCLSRDTVIKTKHGYCRIDQVDGTIPIEYVDANVEMQHTCNYLAHKTGNKKCYKLKLQDGSWIKVTDEHLIFTNEGCVKFVKIRQNPQKYKVWSTTK